VDRGIGCALAQGLLEAGARVVVHGRDHARVEATAARLEPVISAVRPVMSNRARVPNRSLMSCSWSSMALHDAW
jgi:NAD(P)-dependent dehydrogenase (short-subunit alcohol dehydrogenase family)